MAYNHYYPMAYNPYQQAMQQGYQAMQQPQPSYGLIPVRGAEEAKSYPIAPNNCLTFRDETAPYIYSKSMGASQLDIPVFEKYRLVREDDTPREARQEQRTEYALRQDCEALRAELDALRAEIDALKMEREVQEHE